MNQSFKMIQLSSLNSENKVVEIKLNRPESKNALNTQLIIELNEAIYNLQKQDVKVVIIKGCEGNFAAGADIKEMLDASLKEIQEFTNRVAEIQYAMKVSPIIFISAIEGHCLGGGLELALSTDIKIASETAIFGFPEVKLGILPGGGGTQRLLTLTGSSFASHYILSGELFTAQKAYDMKIISEIVSEVDKEALEMGKKIAQHNGHALKAIKELITGIENQELTVGLQLERQMFQSLFTIGEAREGLLAFVEKRRPNYVK
ncbi:enoyl-CoA hydratase/isomerase family protein [Solibacillus sp. FSL K6-1523]|uniref:enoyl-CoA hydratase/isomerase family protein n=1 Tax=Solibacillus sp. FSL K6-1523 TaxID=2921471 RepID=UPI0030F97F67